MTQKISANSIYNYIVIVLIILTIAIRGGASFKWLVPQKESNYTLDEIQEVYKDAAKFNKNSDGSISILDKNKNQLTKAIYSVDFNAKYQGYAGETPLLIYFNKENHISKVQLLKNEESPGYIKHITNKGLLNAWDNIPLDSISINKHVDAVTGATFSSNAIINTVNKTLRNYLAVQSQGQNISFKQILRAILTVILIFLSLSMVFRNWLKKYYWYYLGVVVIVFGIWLKQMLSLETLNFWLLKGLPWQSNWELIVVLFIAIVMAILGHKNYYCTYLCPMGGLQMIISKISPFKKKGLQLKISKVTLRSVYLTFIWGSLILGYSLPLSDMEPFKAFSFTVASEIMLGAGVVIILLSFIFNRPWCQLCPTGCLLNSVPSLKSKKNKNVK